METFFATPETQDRQELAIEIALVNDNPVMSGLLNSVSGMLAVVNEYRQVIAINDSFLKMLGIKNPQKAMGLRLGEVLECVHADDKPTGCGTTQYCSTCGAAVSMVASLGKNRPVEKICALSASKDDVPFDLSLLVRSHPIDINQRRLLLLFIQDITRQQNRSALERTFFHDINNLLGVLVGASELLVDEQPSDLADSIYQMSLRLKNEVAIQRCLSKSDSTNYQTMWHPFSARQIIDELKTFFYSHPAAGNKHISFPDTVPDHSVRTDNSLLQRVLNNMVINALEATSEGGTIKIRVKKDDSNLCFHVWNKQMIDPEIQSRVFQRNFSTKEQSGRGLGTFSMKFFGENILGGKVAFTTSKSAGTTFTYSAPI
ncbi:MAG: PAS domain-containing sensor histidine kinase [Desulfobacterales bacterium]|nr:PAS domain-containing sensor histidine kinase [Desulfobacterales bacterium]